MSPAIAALATTVALWVAAVRRCVEMSQAVAHTLAEEAAAFNGEHASSSAPQPGEGWGGGWGGCGSAGWGTRRANCRRGREWGRWRGRRLIGQSSIYAVPAAPPGIGRGQGWGDSRGSEATQRLAEITTLVAAHLHALAMSLTANDSEDGYE
jgi:hypothetical protein